MKYIGYAISFVIGWFIVETMLFFLNNIVPIVKPFGPPIGAILGTCLFMVIFVLPGGKDKGIHRFGCFLFGCSVRGFWVIRFVLIQIIGPLVQPVGIFLLTVLIFAGGIWAVIGLQKR